MKRRFRLRPSPATVIACIALFVSLGGVSYGVATGYIDSREIRDNQVRSKDLRNNDIRTQDLRNNEVRGIDVRNSTIQGRDIGVSTIRGEDIRESTLAEVPLATRAKTADASPVLRVIQPVAVAQGGAPVALASNGALTLSAACVSTGTGPRADVRIQSTVAASAADGEEASIPILGPGNGSPAIASVGGMAARETESSAITAWSPTGAALSGVVSLLADPAGAGVCRFGGHAVLGGLPSPTG